MGRSTTPKYALHTSGGRNARTATTPMSWDRHYGRPTAKNLERWVAEYHRSLEPGGVNVHISRSLGYVPYLNSARIVHNDGSNEVVAEWHAPMFMAVGPTAEPS